MASHEVWVVEDNDLDWEPIRQFLHSHQVPALHFVTLEAMLQTLEMQSPPGLILLDMILPGRTGFDFLLERNSDPALSRIPVIVMSGVCDPRAVAQVMGLTAHLQKPLRWDRLEAELRKLELLPAA